MGSLHLVIVLANLDVDGNVVGGHPVMPMLISLRLATYSLDKAGCFKVAKFV